ncbi:hypothetical protein ACHAXH_009804 [Discostella pseudostelligera]
MELETLPPMLMCETSENLLSSGEAMAPERSQVRLRRFLHIEEFIVLSNQRD